MAEATRVAEGAAERAGAARNEVQRIDGDLALVRGQTAALREAVERADAELAAREDAHDLPALPKGFAWLHERIASPDVVRTALGRAVAIAGTGSLDAPAPKGCRRITDGVAIFIAPDDATALAAATTLRAGAVIAPSGLLVLPGLARIVDPRQRAERDATTQLAAMAARLHEELITATFSRNVPMPSADAKRRTSVLPRHRVRGVTPRSPRTGSRPAKRTSAISSVQARRAPRRSSASAPSSSLVAKSWRVTARLRRRRGTPLPTSSRRPSGASRWRSTRTTPLRNVPRKRGFSRRRWRSDAARRSASATR